MNVDGKRLRVTATAEQSVAGTGTELYLFQWGTRVYGRYRGGAILRGCLSGTIRGRELRFRYAQREASGSIHGGHSVCELRHLGNGWLRIVEHFTWDSRPGSGTNIFDEIPSRY